MVDTWRHLVTGTQPQNETFAQNYNVGNKKGKSSKIVFLTLCFPCSKLVIGQFGWKNDIHSQIAVLPE